ncbi:hypothetical protein S-CBS1_gp18 [Synechococcus phage S-CBS1]|uniref:minor tail protein n=1 Tax=Synechococcus phage S-CBS1 TaxID=909297 RepID=UPI000231E28E|nr:minor tail protein [Synechococcus phage S-CBS1]ADP06623.1 hypothetical protein S-CBS1_gp18 [Synechococcus phage S-CBS1]
MATFPSLQPASRIYTPGTNASTEFAVLDGYEASVRHSNASVGHVLRMTFRRLTSAERFSLVSHYALHGIFEPFDLDSATLIATNLTFPSDYLWRYLSPPQLDQTCDVTNATVELQLLPPYLI